MPHAIRIHQTGGPEVLGWEEVDVPPPAAGEATVRHHAVGLNFIDTYHRTGLYPLPLPAGIGAALIMPATLSILTNVFPPHERQRAIATWAGTPSAPACRPHGPWVTRTGSPDPAAADGG